ncbi:hypothetical protein LTR91_001147 [Friedmanniomyces endolithicus]|uniref:PCI domain-containing protein n=1 Tax=Friedmanniomyces endolithicus TaxID=329885 RepID=A0AAN6L0N3_9PEZI|nr:hypothetical protein LTR35_015549 [Friedmanniomyces endolithicus]KAK0299935.1 hypothetical protein LTS00_001705 [Friedmanniomyces endolithicus]KAK0318021.1 hypothetical protein LTR82_011011 [Friedmanniomyces endolithicus]KAK0922983.1 hypothetical protein LTR57_007280 [Friedmanniomyces endolithicus]KAK1011358.1 hypothetical protein LTS01_001214 [Friedmanniomyces endolithicus]
MAFRDASATWRSGASRLASSTPAPTSAGQRQRNTQRQRSYRDPSTALEERPRRDHSPLTASRGSRNRREDSTPLSRQDRRSGQRPPRDRSPPPLLRGPRRFRDRSPSPGSTRTHEVVSPTPPPPPPDLGTFDRAWILDRLEKLNRFGENLLTDSQRYDVCINVVERELADFLDQPLTHATYHQITPVLANAVLYAKAVTYAPDSANPVQYQQQPTMATPLLGQFLVQINGFVQARNESGLADWIALEPPFNEQYGAMIREIQSAYPRGSEDALEKRCSSALKAAAEGDDGSPWTAFTKFMAQYLAYLRDVSADVNRYLDTYALLSELQQRANSALSHSTLGHLMLPVVVANAKLVCRLAIGLDKQPELIAHLKRSGGGGAGGGGDEGGARETLPERAANILRQAFVTCLNDRVSSLSAAGKPEGKKRGIYIIANLCLKILFQCRKTRNATQIFENIYNLSPPLLAYPKRERVTYLYYLGRFLFQNSHFYRAQLVLQTAYDESPARPECVRQRRRILIYLIASNIILGRFPSQALLSRPEAQGLAAKFVPICLAIQRGDLAGFRRQLDIEHGEHAEWFLHFRILLQLRNRCEVLVWRSLVRRVFVLAGHKPMDDGVTNKAPTLDVRYLVVAFRKMEDAATAADDYIDPDFEGVDYGDTGEELHVDQEAVVSKLTSLIDQGLLCGFISHKLMKFAVTGTKAKGGDALAAGFPRVWAVLRARAEKSEGGGGEVPGWKKKDGGVGGQKAGPGMVFNFSSMRPVGVVG